ncbi:MAG: hypothetical protein H7Z37_00005, partial [Pyrinomonadaceae bacterium]|nr:hypothetical protein [Pyrinomonadaceae bacterium]
IATGAIVQFGSGFVGFSPGNFLDPNMRARYTTVTGNGKTSPNQLVGDNFQNSANADTIRFDAPNSTKVLYMNRQGKLYLRDTVTPSNGDEILLSKITPSGSNSAPIVKNYRNVRDVIDIYSKTAVANDASSRQFEYDFALPIGVQFFRYYAITQTTRHLYAFPPPGTVNFDAPTTIEGIADGDTWVVEVTILSSL